MPVVVEPAVRLIAWTQFQPPPEVDWHSDADGGQALAEFAGRACYQAWERNNPATADNLGYLRHILQVGHLAVLEHANATFYLTGISRALGHELTRHRHFSFSQLSPRHLPTEASFVEPAVFAEDPQLHEAFLAAMHSAEDAHQQALAALTERHAESEQAGLRRKQLRQAARAILPGAAETQLVMTGNYRAWRHLLAMRASEHADREMRLVAVSCLRQLQQIAPHVFGDFTITSLADGSELAASPLVTEV
ncbi:MAG TPA: FAD-dependent thymidylate synthase [Jatrophihabitans sp.]|nr:FAD-dependent thymidylate synthase [Jatrophihabitans sp.]